MFGVISTNTVLLGITTSSFVQEENKIPAESIAKKMDNVFIKRVLLNQYPAEFKKRALVSGGLAVHPV
jgi:hypothetical protein